MSQSQTFEQWFEGEKENGLVDTLEVKTIKEKKEIIVMKVKEIF